MTTEILPTARLSEAEAPPLEIMRRKIAAFIVSLEQEHRRFG
jgi:hypothetical protein